MSKKEESKYLAAAIGTAFVASMTFAGTAAADANPFQVAELDSGYLQLAEKDAEGKCGEGKCGGDKDAEGKCGEGKCGGDKAGEKKDGEGSCGGDKDGEGSCGGDA